ncbi:MAG: YczE/YyaS/YitT family protein [Acidimicrobiia bacterium]
MTRKLLTAISRANRGAARPADHPVSVVAWPRGRDWGQRVPRMLCGLAVLAIAVVLALRAGLGLAPWDVLHQGLGELLGIPIGTTAILVGFVVLLGWIPLRERPGLGTVANMLFVGLGIDVLYPLVPSPSFLAVRIGFLGASLLCFGIATGLYIGAGLGAGPRDGLMTSIAARGVPLWLVRTVIEVTVLVIGALLGGTVGVGTVVLALGIGPAAHVCLHLLRVREPAQAPTGIGLSGE